jgi:hypothetical protein
MKTSTPRDQNLQSQVAILVYLNLIQPAAVAEDINLKGVAHLKAVLSLLSKSFPSRSVACRSAEWAY